MFLFSLDKYLEELLLDHMIVLVLIFWGLSVLFSIVATLIHILPIEYEGSLFYTFLTILVITCCVFDNSHSDRCEVISHYFDLYFPDDQWCWTSFRVPIYQLHVFFVKMSVQLPRASAAARSGAERPRPPCSSCGPVWGSTSFFHWLTSTASLSSREAAGEKWKC